MSLSDAVRPPAELHSDDPGTDSTVQTWAELTVNDPDAIRNILDQEEPWKSVSSLPVDLVQGVVDFLQSELDDISAEDTTDYRAVCFMCLRALSTTYEIFPSQLYLPRKALLKDERNFRTSGIGEQYKHHRAWIRNWSSSVCVTRWVSSDGGAKDDKGVMHAVLTWRQLRHANILPLYAVSTEFFPDTFCFITPWKTQGTALDYLRENSSRDFLLGWVRDIAAAMKYLHELTPCVIHGSITAESILIRDDLHCYLAGFWERRLDPLQFEDVNHATVTGRAHDVYSFGLTIIELYTGQRNVVDSAFGMPTLLRDEVVLPCVNPVGTDRPSAGDIIKSVYRHFRGPLRLDVAARDVEDPRLSPAYTIFNPELDLNGNPFLDASAYSRPKLDGATSSLLRARLEKPETWRGINDWARDQKLDVHCYIPKTSFQEFYNMQVNGGGFSDIYNGNILGQSVCVKRLKVHKTGPYSIERMKKILSHEALIWRQATHSNILPFYGVSLDVILHGLCLVSPWMTHGNVRDYLNANSTHDPGRWVWDVANAMQYLHSLDPCIIHKDIRGANVLVGDDFRAYLSDFGISLVDETPMPGTNTRELGNVRWLPPELVNPSEGSQNPMTAWDIYSFGCTVLEMYTRQNPYSEFRDKNAVIIAVSKKILPRRPPTDILPTPVWESLVVPCLSWNPSRRPSAGTILEILRSPDFNHKSRRPGITHFSKSAIEDREDFLPGGRFSDISRATIVIGHRREIVCLKRLLISSGKPHGGKSKSNAFDTVLEDFTREAFIWRQLSHRNILPFYDISKEVMDYPSLCLISPWMEDGNINEFLENNPEHDRLGMVWDIASGIAYLHGFDPCIIHKDIRGSNILVGPKPHHRCCLADFGISLIQKPALSERGAGNLRWSAPELLLRPADYDPAHLWAADIYSFGCTIIEIYTGKAPYSDVKSDAAVMSLILDRILPEKPPADVLPSELWRRVVRYCLFHTPTDRLSATEILYSLGEMDSPSLKEYWEMIGDKVVLPRTRSSSSFGDEDRKLIEDTAVLPRTRSSDDAKEDAVKKEEDAVRGGSCTVM